jgi:DNA modification methylase
MAKQHENYLDALQELIDNAVAATIPSESYFDDPSQPVNISLSLVRGEETLTTCISDCGPGITRDDLRDHVFRTGSKEISEGILNNVGWGLKASIAWFEQSLKQRDLGDDRHWFSLVTQTKEEPLTRVDGPITGELPIRDAAEDAWTIGVPDVATAVNESDHGTRIQVDCARDQFDNDVWPAADSLGIKAQYIRERLGVLFRRLLGAHEETQITIHYRDFVDQTSGSFTVPAISPIYQENSELKTCEFAVEGTDGAVYDVTYRGGKLDIEAMRELAEAEYPELLTQSGRFRFRYRPNQTRQGVDIYANGRVLMTSVFEKLFDLTRNNQYNYFGGELQILPSDGQYEVPTDNKKTRLDTNSSLWQGIQVELSQPELHPEGKEYGKRVSSGGASGNERPDTKETEPISQRSYDISIGELEEVYGLHQADTTAFIPELRSQVAEEAAAGEGFLDATVTSPPYFDMKDYGSGDQAEVGQQSNYREYLTQLQEIFDDIYTMTKDDGSLWVIVNTFRRNREVVQLPFDIARVCQSVGEGTSCPNCGESILTSVHEPDGRQVTCGNCEETVDQGDSWRLQDIIVWNKNHALPFTKKGRLRNVFEYILCFSKSGEFELDMDSIRQPDPAHYKRWWADFPERYHPLGKLPENIWKFTPPTRGSFTGNDETIDHPAALPPQLIRRILNLSTDAGDVVLDPFAGSGVVVAESEVMDRKAIGVELNQDYCDDYPEVEGYVRKLHSQREQQGDTEAIENLICGLRQTKYPRMLLEQIAEQSGFNEAADLDIHTVFAISREHGYQSVAENIHGDVDIYLIADDESTARELIEYTDRAEEAITKRPCSGFGIKANVEILRSREFKEELAEGDTRGVPGELFVYQDGRHYVYEDQVNLSDWFTQSSPQGDWVEKHENDSTPPILSNLGLEVNHPKHSMETVERSLSGDHEFIRYSTTSEPIRSVIEHRPTTPTSAD